MRYKKIRGDEEPPKKPFEWKSLAILCGATILSFALYFTGCAFHFKPVVYIYYGLLLVTLTVFLIMNGGFTRDVPTPDMLNEKWDAARKERFIHNLVERRKKAKWLLYIIIPLLFTLGLDMIYLFFLSGAK